MRIARDVASRTVAAQRTSLKLTKAGHRTVERLDARGVASFARHFPARPATLGRLPVRPLQLNEGTLGGRKAMPWTGEYTELEAFLRSWQNALGDEVPYDANGLFVLLLAIVDNLREHTIDADFEGFGETITPEQAAFLARLVANRLDAKP